MRRLALVLALAFLATPSAAQVEAGQTFTARVVSVTDGDTYDVKRSAGGEVTIRLHGVDAPETSQPGGKAATRAARRYVGGKKFGYPSRRSAATAGLWPLWRCREATWAPCSSAMGSRGGTANTPQMKPNTPAFSDRPATPAVACGHRTIQRRHGRGGTACQDRAKRALRTATALIFRLSPRPSGSSKGTSRVILTAWMATTTAKRASRCRADEPVSPLPVLLSFQTNTPAPMHPHLKTLTLPHQLSCEGCWRGLLLDPDELDDRLTQRIELSEERLGQKVEGLRSELTRTVVASVAAVGAVLAVVIPLAIYLMN